MKIDNTKLPEKNYTVVSRELINTPQLSARAKMIYVYIADKPKEWDFSYRRIAEHFKDGKAAIATALKELETEGFLIRKWVKVEGSPKMMYEMTRPKMRKPEKRATTKKGNHKPEPVSNTQKSKNQVSKKQTDVEIEKDPKIIQRNKEIVAIIDRFGDLKINEAYQNWYGNATERRAIETLLSKFHIKTIIGVIDTLPITNPKPYWPSIYKPSQLLDKWRALEAAWQKEREKQEGAKQQVIV